MSRLLPLSLVTLLSFACSKAPPPMPSVSLDKAGYTVGDSIRVTFSGPIITPGAEKAWLTLAPAGSPDSEFGTWHYVQARAVGDVLETKAAGNFEVRLHDGYPRVTAHVVARVPVVVAPAKAAVAPVAPAPAGVAAFTLAAAEFKVGSSIAVTFTAPLAAAAGEKHWLTLAPASSPDSEFGTWHYVQAGATSDTLAAGTAGSFEVRLHDGYPRTSFHVVSRQTVLVR